ncbi:MAG TPA: ferritin-like domain-containing protein [Thermoanaerobaculia bacterium]|nr:ferritin-like domain-containing protein [Thermoanaerobaculia bacterium]
MQKLLRFGETETDGGRDLLRAAELTRDPLLRRLYLLHAVDEQRHGSLFRRRAAAMLASGTGARQDEAATPAGHGLDDLDVERESDETMLAFLHVAERSAASRFAVYRNVLGSDPETQRIFDDILHDEKFHMNYTLTQLVRVSPERHRAKLWRARLTRLWNAYLRVASALAGVMGGAILTVQYFVVLPLFAMLSKRAAAREREGWRAVAQRDADSMRSQY